MNTWISSSEALSMLNVRAQTLYANVSRGKIRTKRDPVDTRKSLYHSGDVARLCGRHRGQRRLDDVVAEVTGWGHPIMTSSISTVKNGVLLYRGINAIDLARSWSLEDVASLLWQSQKFKISEPAFNASERIFYSACPIEKTMQAVSSQMHLDPFTRAQPEINLKTNAIEILARVIYALFGGTPKKLEGSISQIACNFWEIPEAENSVREALCLLADHELNASTFATRVVISTGASFCSGIIAGLAALSGPLHGRVYTELNSLISRSNDIGTEPAIKEWTHKHNYIPGFGHPLYPEGDIRCKALLSSIPQNNRLQEIQKTVIHLTGELPNIDFALACLVEHYKLPSEAPIYLYIAARTVGWLAHAMEQSLEGKLIRPRARYQ
ncbi:citrate synthase [Pseudomonas sp.]|uniref:citrate synthase n=1 Tax=Pseudomonas sp. TaxID=306 RepID=UPI003D6DFF1E